MTTLPPRPPARPPWQAVPSLWLVAAGAALAESGEVTANAAEGAASPLATLLRLVAALLVVLLAFWVCARLMRRLAPGAVGGAGSNLRVVGALSLGQRERVVLVQVGDEQLLLGVSAGRVERLHLLRHPLDDEPRSRPSSGSGLDFRESLRSAMRRRVPS